MEYRCYFREIIGIPGGMCRIDSTTIMDVIPLKTGKCKGYLYLIINEKTEFQTMCGKVLAFTEYKQGEPHLHER